MQLIFFFQILQNFMKISKIQQKSKKMFLIFDIIPLELVAGNLSIEMRIHVIASHFLKTHS